MYTNNKYDGMIFEKVESLYLLGTKFDIFISEGIEMYDPSNLIKECKQYPQTILELIDEENRYEITINNEGRNYSKLVVDEPGLYQLFMVIDNPRAKKFRANISNILATFRKKLGYDLYTIINRAENNEWYFDNLKPCIRSLATCNTRLREILDQHTDNILITEVYEFPTIDKMPVLDEYTNINYIKNIDKAGIGFRVYYFIDLKYAMKSLTKTLQVTEELLVKELSGIELRGDSISESNIIYVDPVDIYNYIDRVHENNHLGDIGKGTSEDIFTTFLNYIVDDIVAAKILSYSITRFKNITEDRSYDILNKYKILKNETAYSDDKDVLKYIKNQIVKKYLPQCNS
mgnify:CR=1 FL=1